MRRISEVPQVSFLGWMLQPATSVKDLGDTLDPHLTYDYHITHVVSSCFSKLYRINRVKKSFIKETLKLLIASLVFSKMLYCSTVWSITSAGNVSKLQSIQNFASQIITNSKGLFTRYDFVACDKLTTGLRHELFRVNQTYNSLTTLKSCRRPVVSLSHATKSCRVNRP